MKRLYKIKPKRTLRDNLQFVIPQIFDDFFSIRKPVINHPKRKDLLHQMRIAGKPLRYIMELGENAFGEDFSKCLDEYKDVIELLGDIHDTDVLIPELVQQLKEVRNYNKMILIRSERFSTKGLRDMLNNFRSKRNHDFSKLKDIISEWEKENFRERLVLSMEKKAQAITAEI